MHSVYEVYSRKQQCPGPSHSLTAPSLTHPEQLLVLHAPFMVSGLLRCAIFILYATFLNVIFQLPFTLIIISYQFQACGIPVRQGTLFLPYLFSVQIHPSFPLCFNHLQYLVWGRAGPVQIALLKVVMMK